jgi:hypothetical protein
MILGNTRIIKNIRRHNGVTSRPGGGRNKRLIFVRNVRA